MPTITLDTNKLLEVLLRIRVRLTSLPIKKTGGATGSQGVLVMSDEQLQQT